MRRIRYFTARSSARPNNLQSPSRQDIYLRALATLPLVTIHFGQFFLTTTRMPLAHPSATGPRTVEVMKTEEKGSDVNLATHLVADAFRGDADTFVVVSNDSDLREPIRLVRHELGHSVGILNPHPRPSMALQRCQPTFTKQIRKGALGASQFPVTLRDATGTFSKPRVGSPRRPDKAEAPSKRGLAPSHRGGWGAEGGPRLLFRVQLPTSGRPN